jgi:hypothetical protein
MIFDSIGMKNVSVVSELLKPYNAQTMRCYPVSERTNRVANDDAECSAPVERRNSESDPSPETLVESYVAPKAGGVHTSP